MGHVDRPRPLKPEGDGFWKVLLEYVSVAGCIFLIVNTVNGLRLKEVSAIVTSHSGQAVLVLFGALSVASLWAIGRLRGGM